MTDCPKGEIRDLLPDLLHDRLAPDVQLKVKTHVRGCSDCQDELALLRAMRSSLQRAPAMNAGGIAAAIPPYRAPVRPSWGGWRAAAAIVILAAGGTSVAVLQREAPRGADSAAVSTTTVARRVGVTPAAPLRDAPARAETASIAAPRELALGSSAVSDLDDSELSTLLKGLQTLDVLPSPDVEPSPVSVVSPTGTE